MDHLTYNWVLSPLRCRLETSGVRSQFAASRARCRLWGPSMADSSPQPRASAPAAMPPTVTISGRIIPQPVWSSSPFPCVPNVSPPQHFSSSSVWAVAFIESYYFWVSKSRNSNFLFFPVLATDLFLLFPACVVVIFLCSCLCNALFFFCFVWILLISSNFHVMGEFRQPYCVLRGWVCCVIVSFFFLNILKVWGYSCWGTSLIE